MAVRDCKWSYLLYWLIRKLCACFSSLAAMYDLGLLCRSYRIMDSQSFLRYLTAGKCHDWRCGWVGLKCIYMLVTAQVGQNLEVQSTCWMVTDQWTNPMTIYWMPTLYQHESCKSWKDFQVNSQNKVRVRWQSVGGRPGTGLYLCQGCPRQEDRKSLSRG